MLQLLQTLVNASEKAAELARVFKSEKSFQLLIQEKGIGEKNARFKHDFKTLADVFIQEIIHKEVADSFPEMKDFIYGEENKNFKMHTGETLTVNVNSQEDTSALLKQVFLENHKAAEMLAKIIYHPLHHKMDLDSISVATDKLTLDYSDLAIWIDPLDGTAEYIESEASSVSEDENEHSGRLQYVTVLIGVFQKSTHLPVIGVINQPFSKFDLHANCWKSQCWWGVKYGQTSASSIKPPLIERERSIVIISENESPEIRRCLDVEFDVLVAPGAGYKTLAVLLGIADVYLLSKASTFCWDTCAPQAVLKSIGGDILDFTATVDSSNARPQFDDRRPLSLRYYTKQEMHLRNEGGIIAFADPAVLLKVVNCLKNFKSRK